MWCQAKLASFERKLPEVGGTASRTFSSTLPVCTLPSAGRACRWCHCTPCTGPVTRCVANCLSAPAAAPLGVAQLHARADTRLLLRTPLVALSCPCNAVDARVLCSRPSRAREDPRAERAPRPGGPGAFNLKLRHSWPSWGRFCFKLQGCTGVVSRPCSSSCVPHQSRQL